LDFREELYSQESLIEEPITYLAFAKVTDKFFHQGKDKAAQQIILCKNCTESFIS